MISNGNKDATTADDDDEKLISFDTSAVEDHDEQEERVEPFDEEIRDENKVANEEEDLLGIFEESQNKASSGIGLYGDFESSDNAKQARGIHLLTYKKLGLLSKPGR